jgi:hypothetical protein
VSVVDSNLKKISDTSDSWVALSKVDDADSYAYLFENESLYDRVDPYMVLRGLKYIWEKNQGRHSA